MPLVYKENTYFPHLFVLLIHSRFVSKSSLTKLNMHVTNIVGIWLTIILVGFIDPQGNIDQLELTVFLHVLQEVAYKSRIT